jgi:hypothetical protein
MKPTLTRSARPRRPSPTRPRIVTETSPSAPATEAMRVAAAPPALIAVTPFDEAMLLLDLVMDAHWGAGTPRSERAVVLAADLVSDRYRQLRAELAHAGYVVADDQEVSA